MKIDKINPRHWLSLILFGMNTLAALAIRPFFHKRNGKNVVLYGHQLNGNLLAIHDYWRRKARTDFSMVFLTMDKNYQQQLLKEEVNSVLATRPNAFFLLLRADAIVSDHGLHVMSILLRWSSIKFFDVWHGISFDADPLPIQRRYDEVWVASPSHARRYVEMQGFDPDIVKVTGYARSDRLVRQEEDLRAIRRAFDLDGEGVGKIILFAPTWKQDSAERSVYPFGMDGQAFLQRLSAVAEQADATLVVRLHLNSAIDLGVSRQGRVVHRPSADYPDTEALLLISDILICDWSSIAFDYLLLDRPTLFLDVEPPFDKRGLALGPEYRYGRIIVSMNDLEHALRDDLHSPAAYHEQFGERAMSTRQAIYADYADGQAARRCIQRLCKRVESNAVSDDRRDH